MFLILSFLPIICFSKSINLEIHSTIKIGKSSETQRSVLRVELGKEFILPHKNSKVLMRVEELNDLARGPGGERPLIISAEVYDLKRVSKALISRPRIITYMNKKVQFLSSDNSEENSGDGIEFNLKPF